ncbi:hypothetical protein [Pontibacter chinhatensis]|uniref:Lipocalin-like domain-containing protein n=1 Tax=Pontibacter chinhatensis TaxID=1436961 RepID=A0A1I2V8F4_9BACT|nr:hypothetical protein [Pontibacter chinhatensis]SFG85655.1 hypothetical protein SAMN05421739_10489 [Pontibacter chinhatensis]
MRNAFVFCLLCLLFMAVTCKPDDKVVAQLAGKVWLHSFEEDEEGLWVYRPNTYDFPPSRGRTGFSAEAGGVFKRYEIAPADGLQEETGEWTHLKKNLVEVRMAEGSNPPLEYRIEIVSISDSLLKVKRLE